jgi:hypothetical protein
VTYRLKLLNRFIFAKRKRFLFCFPSLKYLLPRTGFLVSGLAERLLKTTA